MIEIIKNFYCDSCGEKKEPADLRRVFIAVSPDGPREEPINSWDSESKDICHDCLKMIGYEKYKIPFKMSIFAAFKNKFKITKKER